MAVAVTDPMSEADIMLMVFQSVLVLMALCSAGIGGTVLVRRKPLVFSSAWLMGFIMLLCISPIIDSLITIVERLKENAADFRDISMILFAGLGGAWARLLLTLLLPLVALMLLRIQMPGYMVIGVNEQTIRDAIHYGLQELASLYKEAGATIRLPELNTGLQVKMRLWGDEGELKISDRSQSAFLGKLVMHMRVYFKAQNVPTKKIAATLYLAAAVFLTAILFFEF